VWGGGLSGNHCYQRLERVGMQIGTVREEEDDDEEEEEEEIRKQKK
jgi:hypothetical protein